MAINVEGGVARVVTALRWLATLWIGVAGIGVVALMVTNGRTDQNWETGIVMGVLIAGPALVAYSAAWILAGFIKH